MDCEEARRNLEDLHDGELGSQAAAAASAHLAGCAECAAGFRQLEDEARLYRSYAAVLDRQTRNATCSWPQVRAAVAARSREAGPPGWWSSLFNTAVPAGGLGRQLACAALLVIVSVGVTLFVVRQQGIVPERPGQALTTSLDLPQTGGTVAEAVRSIRHAEQEYVDAIRTLTGIVDRQKPGMSRELMAEVERNLRQIDDSIAATRKAYYEHPADPELAHYMLTAYSRKVELLQELASLQVPQPKT